MQCFVQIIWKLCRNLAQKFNWKGKNWLDVSWFFSTRSCYNFFSTFWNVCKEVKVLNMHSAHGSGVFSNLHLIFLECHLFNFKFL